MQFYVYNSDDLLRWIPNHRVNAQPGQEIEVHGGKFQSITRNLCINTGCPCIIQKYDVCFNRVGKLCL